MVSSFQCLIIYIKIKIFKTALNIQLHKLNITIKFQKTATLMGRLASKYSIIIFLTLFADIPPCTCSLPDILCTPVIDRVSSILQPSLLITKLCRTTQALTISVAKSGFKFIGLWKIFHLLLIIPNVHSTYLRALDRRQLNFFFDNQLMSTEWSEKVFVQLKCFIINENTWYFGTVCARKTLLLVIPIHY